MDKIRGKFITFEGGEGVGKSTQSKLFVEELNKNGIKTIWSREPGGCDDAEAIRELVISGATDKWDGITELLLIYAARRVHTEKKIKPLIKDGITVVSDRYFDSSLAYQGFGHGVSIEKVETVRQIVLDDFKPDLTILLDMDMEKALDRANVRGDINRFEEMDFDFHKRVKDGFEYIVKKEPDRFIKIDVTGLTVDAVLGRVVSSTIKFFS